MPSMAGLTTLWKSLGGWAVSSMLLTFGSQNIIDRQKHHTYVIAKGMLISVGYLVFFPQQFQGIQFNLGP